MTKIELQPIGVIHTPFSDPKGMPIQPSGAIGVKGVIEVEESYTPGLKDLDGFSHIMLIYHFHRSEGFALHVIPFLDDKPRGLFATRAPRRPNPVGVSVVRLDRIENGNLHVLDVDMLDGTPLLDIKPYVPEFDSPPDVRLGWLEGVSKDAARRRSDERFG
jgi:tRNA-Thr(GGU) m(6)t(6)A37 methyltransferase TsaA